MNDSGINPQIALNANAPKPANPIAQVGQFAQMANGMQALREGAMTPMQQAMAFGSGGNVQAGLQNLGQMQMLNGMRVPSDYVSPFEGATDNPWQGF